MNSLTDKILELQRSVMDSNVCLWVTSNAKLNELANNVGNLSFEKAEKRKAELQAKADRAATRASIKRLIGKHDSGKMFDDESTDYIYPAMEWNKNEHIYAREARNEPTHS